MLTRIYADNFRCLSNFELELDEANVLLGPNGTGKTAVLSLLRSIQELVVRGSRLDEAFPLRDLSLAEERPGQRFEIEMRCRDDAYLYSLTIDHHVEERKMRVEEERLEHDGNPIFEFKKGDAQLFNDRYEKGPQFPFDWSRSGIGSVHERTDNRKLTGFKRALANSVFVGCCPPLMEAETRSEDQFLDPWMGNFVGWYRRSSNENMGAVVDLFAALREALPGFDAINVTESGEHARSLKVVYRGTGRTTKYGFDQLSDGQRALIALYSLIHLSGDRRLSLFVDEPDNYLALGEVQPWLAEAVQRCGESLEQVVVASHHPVTIDYMAGASGRWFSRERDGPVRVSKEPTITLVDGVSLSDAIAQRWE